MTEDQQEKPKIIVDNDWKAQAQADKEKLAQEVESQAAQEGAAGAAGPAGEGEAGGRPREIPPANFSVLVSSLVTQAFFALGAIEDPVSKKRYVDLDLAKHHIDMLTVLEDKTKGNLTDDEKRALDRAIYEARMQYVQMAQRLTSRAQA